MKCLQNKSKNGGKLKPTLQIAKHHVAQRTTTKLSRRYKEPTFYGERYQVGLFRGPQKEIPSVVTQRAVLSHLSAVFDALGLFALSTRQFGSKKRHKWDKQLQDYVVVLQTNEDLVVFDAWAEELKQVKKFSLQRQYFANSCSNHELHVLSDASLETMCMIAYFGNQNDIENWLSFVIGKCRIAQRKTLSIPRLDHQAALYTVRLRQLISSDHEIRIERFYHSITVLHWLHAVYKKQRVFLANRVAEILETPTIDEWTSVNGKLNPADNGTRGMTFSELNSSDWITGPAWLKSDTSD